MLIRGEKSINASNSPLIVLDGVIFNGDLVDINPSDIETIDILKDGSSAAVYGSRAASGWSSYQQNRVMKESRSSILI